MHTGGFMLLGPAMRMLYYRRPRNSALLMVPTFRTSVLCSGMCAPVY